MLKRLGEGVQFDPNFGFSKIVFSRERVRPWFLVNFSIIISDIFLANFIKIRHVLQKIWRFSSWILAIFANVSDFLTFTGCKKNNGVNLYQMMSALFNLKLLWLSCVTTVSNYINIGLVFLKIWKWSTLQIDPPEKNYFQKGEPC